MIRYLIRIVLELLWYDRQHVGIFETSVNSGPSYNKKGHRAFIHCYESRWGTRYTRIMVHRPDYMNIGNCFLRRRIRKDKLYQTEILPWLQCRLHDKIPSYQKVKGGKWDFLKKLKGETPIVLNDDEK